MRKKNILFGQCLFLFSITAITLDAKASISISKKNNNSDAESRFHIIIKRNTFSTKMFPITKYIILLIITFFHINNSYSFSISNLPDLEESITKSDNIIHQEYSSNHYIHNSNSLNLNPNGSLVLNSTNNTQHHQMSVESNTLITSENDIKLKDQSDLEDIKNRNKLADLMDRKKENSQFISNEQDYSPILHFIITKVRPFIEVRIDSMLVKAGFESYLREKTDLLSQLKINNLSESDVKNVRKAVCGNSAEISFTISDEYGNSIDREYDNKKIWVNIGQNALPRGLELGITGMKINEIREINSPSNLNTGPTSLSKKLFLLGKNSVFKVTLHDIKDSEAFDEIKDNLRFYDVSSSISRAIECIDVISFGVKVLNASGDILYRQSKGKKVYLTVGSGAMPYIEQVILNAKNDGKRIAFVKTKFLEDFKKNPYLIGLEKVFNENESVILELSPHIE
jgi:hypothetical protein